MGPLPDTASGFTDPVRLRSDAYADARNFDARTLLYDYLSPGIDFRDWALSHLRDELGVLLDVGCGPGKYLTRVAARARISVGIDLSEGILPEAHDARLCVGDAQALPFADATFDTVLCMHMLYHVPDMDRAMGELRRVLRSSGVALVATNGGEHQRALRETFDASLADLTGGETQPVLGTARRFRLEDGGEMLRAHFDDVVVHHLPRELIVADVEPVMGYLNSVRSFHESKLPAGVTWERVAERFRARVLDEIERTGTFRSSAHSGVFVCR